MSLITLEMCQHIEHQAVTATKGSDWHRARSFLRPRLEMWPAPTFPEQGQISCIFQLIGEAEARSIGPDDP
jgi:hypothetical protein